MELSNFGEKFTRDSGIMQLMDDMGTALAGSSNAIMMGGGNPGHIPEVEEYFKKRLENIIEDPKEFQRLIAIYDPPQGEMQCISLLVDFFNEQYNWDLTEKNICMTNGSQSAFFIIFNMLAGTYPDLSEKKILFPITPEYIGYTDSGLSENLFTALKPKIEITGANEFKYFIDFENLTIEENIASICVSRPTNPTGNIITDSEVERLIDLAESHNIPLILDCAYGAPFPDLTYTDTNLYWNDSMILCLSLSKLGLPAVRTGIVIANEETIRNISRINAIINLSTGSFGSLLIMEAIRTRDIIKLSKKTIKPFYQNKVQKAVDWLKRALDGIEYYIHKPEGAMFLWVWLKNLPISSQELYEKSKDAGVLIVPGHHFFPGICNGWTHCHECIRITYSQDDSSVEKGIALLGEIIKAEYKGVS